MSLHPPISRFLLVLATTVALAAPATANAAHRRVVSPVLTFVHCTKACSGVHKVAVGGQLVLRGHRIARGLEVVFPPARGHTAVTAIIHLSTSGLVVTVPARAGTGLVHVKDLTGHRSNAIGPVIVVQPTPVVVPPALSDTAPAAFADNGMWIWELPQSSGGSLPAIIAEAKAHDIGTVFVKSSDGPSNWWSQFSPTLLSTLHAAGLKVCAWQYVYGSKPAAEAAMGVRAAQMGADCLVIDAEVEYEGRYSAAQTYVEDLRATLGPDYPIALAGFPYVDFHPSFPYSVFLGPGGAQVNAPQMYWKDIGVSVDTVFSHTYTNNLIYQRPIFPLGQTFQNPSNADIVRFRQDALAYGAAGVSWWDWQETGSSQWSSVSQPLAPLTGFTPVTTLASLAKGAKGDQVVWLQEHLAAVDPGLTVDGEMGTATVTALKAFQTSQSLPATGVTDTPTWTALLKLTPVMADWNGAPTTTAVSSSASSNSSSSGGAHAARFAPRAARTDGRSAPLSAHLPDRGREIPRVG